MIPSTERLHEFRIIVLGGMLLSLNCGFMNGATLLRDPPHTTTHLTGNATQFGIAIASFDFHDFYFYGGVLLSYTFGSVIGGSMTPSKKFSGNNSYGRVLVIASTFILISSIMAVLSDSRNEVCDMIVASSAGIQNAMLSRYSGNIIRVGHVTGGCVDIGVHLGRYVMGATDVLWKIQILIGLVFSFWLGGVLVKWIDPLLDNSVLFVNTAYMITVALGYIWYCYLTGFDRVVKDKPLIDNDPEASPSAQPQPQSGFVSERASKSSDLAFESVIDSDFNLTDEEAKQLHVVLPAPVDSTQQMSMQNRDTKEFSFIMIGASLLALNAGCSNAIAKLSSRGLFVSHVSGSVTTFALNAFSLDDTEALMQSTLILLSFVFGSFLVGMMSSTSVFRLGISYGRVLCLTSAFFIAGTMLYYCFSAMGCGAQNGMITKYSGGVVRTTNVTGSFADIGALIGRVMKGNYADVWQLKVLLPLVFSFIGGGSIGKLLFDAFPDYAPVANAGFIVLLSSLYVFSLKRVSETELSYLQLITGKYTYPEIKQIIRDSWSSFKDRTSRSTAVRSGASCYTEQ